ncbi:hotdog family protein [Hymenobacter tenuis]
MAVAINSAAAQAPTDTTFQRLLRQNQFSLTQTGAQFSGPGWEKLQQDIRKSALVLVGEDHGMAQIPAFTQAVAQVLKPKLYVAEIDKYQARNLSQFAAKPGLPTAFEHKYPMALSFYSWAEEFELARALRAQNTAFVGIEQVGAATAGLTLDVMADHVKNKAAKSYLRRLAAISQARDRADMVMGKYDHSTVNVLQPVTIDSLRTIARQESPAVQDMLENFLASVAIYQTNAAGKPGAHQARLNLMKRNLLTELQPYQKAGEPLPTMLFKFGAAHMGRGRSISGNFYDVGNLAVNLADMHDQKTLHIFVIGKMGEQVGGSNPDDFTKNVATYSYDNENMVKPFTTSTAAAGPWQVFDVRPLRRALLQDKLKVSSQELQATILGYDYVVIIPKTTASRNY